MLNNFFFENRAVYEKKWEKFVQPGRPHMTIWRMRKACWITKATNTFSEYVTFNALLRQNWLREHASMFRYSTYILCP
jgi:hypothetical protein